MTGTLLEWMSFRGKVGLHDVRGELTGGEDARRILRDFVTLGHLEVTGSASWRIAPPVLAGMPPEEAGSAAVLCGARTAALLRRLSEACASEGAWMERNEVVGRPALIRVAAPGASALASVADAAGIPLQNDAGFTLMACTPAISEWPREPCPMVGGNVGAVSRFSRSGINWVDSTLEEAVALPHGFFRIERSWDRVHIIKTGHAECAYMDSRAGCLAVCAGRRLISYDAASRTLSMPRALFPPVLVARALLLCTGALPQIGDRSISFAGVSTKTMLLALAVTQLRLT